MIANRAIEILGGEKGDYSIVHALDPLDVQPLPFQVPHLRM